MRFFHKERQWDSYYDCPCNYVEYWLGLRINNSYRLFIGIHWIRYSEYNPDKEYK